MNYGLNGLNPLSYIGVNPTSPSQTFVREIDPTPNDWQNQQIGNWWFNPGNSNTPLNNAFVLTNLQRNVATWTQVTATGGQLLNLTGDTGTAVPTANSIKIAGGTNINTAAAGSTVTVNLNNSITLTGSISLPNTTSSTVGVINLGGARFIHGFSTGLLNTFVGTQSGNFTLTGNSNTGVGGTVLSSLTTGSSNSAFGAGSLFSVTTGGPNTAVGLNSQRLLTTGSFNSSLGSNTLQNLVTGSFNSVSGRLAGGNYTGAESSNILINSQGVVGDSNIMRLGTATGAGNQELSKTFIHGIRGVTTDVNDAIAVLIDSAGQLGTVSSSIRYKENVEKMGSVSSVIYDLNPVVFDYKNRQSQYKSVGLIAEEVERVAPSLVIYKDGEPETVKYHDLVPMLLNEIMKLNDRIEQLEKIR